MCVVLFGTNTYTAIWAVSAVRNCCNVYFTAYLYVFANLKKATGKVVLFHTTMAYVKCRTTHSQPQHNMKLSAQLHVLVALFQEETFPALMNCRLGDRQSQSGRSVEDKISLHIPGIETRFLDFSDSSDTVSRYPGSRHIFPYNIHNVTNYILHNLVS